jgi:hypothetical protein
MVLLMVRVVHPVPLWSRSLTPPPFFFSAGNAIRSGIFDFQPFQGYLNTSEFSRLMDKLEKPELLSQKQFDVMKEMIVKGETPFMEFAWVSPISVAIHAPLRRLLVEYWRWCQQR